MKKTKKYSLSFCKVVPLAPLIISPPTKISPTCFVLIHSYYPSHSMKLDPNNILYVTQICYAHFVTYDTILIFIKCMQTTCHGMPFLPIRVYVLQQLCACVSRPPFCVFFFGVFVVAPLIFQLFEYSFNAIVSSIVKKNFTLILCIFLNHKVKIGVSILLLSSSNVGCHGIAPRFKVCVFPRMFANTLL